jgi:hypothetical protein
MGQDYDETGPKLVREKAKRGRPAKAEKVEKREAQPRGRRRAAAATAH